MVKQQNNKNSNKTNKEHNKNLPRQFFYPCKIYN